MYQPVRAMELISSPGLRKAMFVWPRPIVYFPLLALSNCSIIMGNPKSGIGIVYRVLLGRHSFLGNTPLRPRYRHYEDEITLTFRKICGRFNVSNQIAYSHLLFLNIAIEINM